MKNKLSVIVPIYGVEDYLEDCIKSIVQQTYKNLEIILVDDGSKDRCPQICDDWAKKDNRIVVIHKENGGLVSARQEGIRLAHGKFITYVDGDDWIEPDMYFNMMSEFNDGIDIVIEGFKKHLNNKELTYYNNISAGVYYKEDIKKEVLPKMIGTDDFFCCGIFTYLWNKIFRKEVILDLQCAVDQRITIGEDAACVYPVIAKAKGIVITKGNGYHYRQRIGSILRTTGSSINTVEKIRILNDYLIKTLNRMGIHELDKNLRDLYISHLIIMSDSVILTDSRLTQNFPFPNIKNCKIILYSVGVFGLHLFQQYKQRTDIEIVAWTDPDYEEYLMVNHKIMSIEHAIKFDYDYIVIASVDFQYISLAKKQLNALKIKKEKIVTIDENLEFDIKILKEYGLLEK